MIDQVTTEVQNILLPNASFYEEHPDDEAKYLVDPATIAALSWVAVAIVVPVLVGVTSSLTTELLKDKLKKPQPSPLTKNDVLELINEWKAASPQKPLCEKNAENSLRELLEFHGWPSFQAEQDALEIVLVIKKKMVG